MNNSVKITNPLALLGLFVLLVDSIVTTLFLIDVPSIILKDWMIGFLVVFIVLFPIIIFIGSFYLIIKHSWKLFSPQELYEAGVNPMDLWQIENHEQNKKIRYGEDMLNNDLVPPSKVDCGEEKKFNERAFTDKIVRQLIDRYKIPYQKDICILKQGRQFYFDAYANYNNCHWFLETKLVTPNLQNDKIISGIERFYKDAVASTDGMRYLTMVLIANDDSIISKIENIINTKNSPSINYIIAKQSNDEVVLLN